MINEWKWSNGSEQIGKSRRPVRQKNNNVSSYDSRVNAITCSLDDDMFNKRENLDEKISERELMLQCGLNPFLSNTSYVNDVVTRDMFLKPINTTCGERAKNKDFE
jgi:hypothetical protein